MLIGDFNAQVGNDDRAWQGIIGSHSLHNQENDNGKRLLDFCCINEYVVGGTLFAHKDIHKGTWLSPTGKTVNQIDHICINKKWCSSLQDVRSYRGADINTTHYLVKSKLKLRLSTNFCTCRFRNVPKLLDFQIDIFSSFFQSKVTTWMVFQYVILCSKNLP